jgi:alcohol dehydrogenase class IV
MVIERFTFAGTPRVHFGIGTFSKGHEIVAAYGTRVLVVTGKRSLQSSGKWNLLLQALAANEMEHWHFAIGGEPSPEVVDQACSELRGKPVDAVLAVGGGSVVDAGKAISAMLPQAGSVLDYLEGVGTRAHSGAKVPFIAVPTTAGTGSEATKNAVLSRVGTSGFKKSLRHDNFIPNDVIIDPELSLSCPARVTAACGMDAFTQLLESYVSTEASPMTDALAVSGMRYVADHLVAAATTGADDVEARAGMAYASFLSGVTLANAGLGVVHGLAGPIGGFFDIPHGVVCGTLIGGATRLNVEALQRKKDEGKAALEKYATIGRLLSGTESQDIAYCCNLLIEKIETWTKTVELPLLSDYGVRPSDIDKIVEKASNKNNPVKLNQEEIREILRCQA